MSPLAVFLQMLDRLRQYLEIRSDRLGAEKEAVDAALTAVNLAANHTRAYLADVRQSAESRDRDIERGLSDDWVTVGECLRRIGDDEARTLYERCFTKARYWSDPDGWDESDANELDIRLEQVLQDVQDAIDK